MFALAMLLIVAAPQAPPVSTVPQVDLDRYLGQWYEIARFPNRFQKKCAGEPQALPDPGVRKIIADRMVPRGEVARVCLGDAVG